MDLLSKRQKQRPSAKRLDLEKNIIYVHVYEFMQSKTCISCIIFVLVKTGIKHSTVYTWSPIPPPCLRRLNIYMFIVCIAYCVLRIAYCLMLAKHRWFEFMHKDWLIDWLTNWLDPGLRFTNQHKELANALFWKIDKTSLLFCKGCENIIICTFCFASWFPLIVIPIPGIFQNQGCIKDIFLLDWERISSSMEH